MKELLKYRDNSYFNDTDYFVLLDIGLNKLIVTDLERSNGYWYPKMYRGYENGLWGNRGSLQFKMTTVPVINCNELYGLKVTLNLPYKENGIHKIYPTELTGNITKFILDGIGVNWKQGQGKLHRKYGFPYFWNNPNYLEIT